MALFEISNTQNIENIEISKPVYGGVVTRKRAAMNIMEEKVQKKGCRRNFVEKENNCEIKSELNKGTEEPKKIDLDKLISEPFQWTYCSDKDNKDTLSSIFSTLRERRNKIRQFYIETSDNEIPIWFPEKSCDEFLHADYLPMILDHLLEKEEFYEPLGINFLGVSCDVTYRHRYKLVDTIVQMNDLTGMSNETLQLSIAMMDRFIKALKTSIKKEDILIISAMCLFIAGKIEEVYVHSLEEFLEVVKIEYALPKCTLLEEKILSTMDFNLSIPLPLAFIRHYNILFKGDKNSHLYSRYFCELSLQDYKAAGYTSNMIGSSCVFLAQVICQNKADHFEEVWTPMLQCSSGLLYVDFKDLVINLCLIIGKQQIPSTYRAIALKYSSSRYNEVAKTVIRTDGLKNIIKHFRRQ